MSRRWVVLLIFFCVQAEAKFNLALGYYAPMERKASGEHGDILGGMNLQISRAWQKWQAILEAAKYESTSGRVPINMKLERQELMPWIRYSAKPEDRWSPFAAIGVGFYKDRVKTQFYEQVGYYSSRWEWMAGVGVGYSAQLFKNFKYEIELRMNYQFVAEKEIPAMNMRIVSEIF